MRSSNYEHRNGMQPEEKEEYLVPKRGGDDKSLAVALWKGGCLLDSFCNLHCAMIMKDFLVSWSLSRRRHEDYGIWNLVPSFLYWIYGKRRMHEFEGKENTVIIRKTVFASWNQGIFPGYCISVAHFLNDVHTGRQINLAKAHGGHPLPINDKIKEKR